jgi:hypothetical protein
MICHTSTNACLLVALLCCAVCSQYITSSSTRIPIIPLLAVAGLSYLGYTQYRRYGQSGRAAPNDINETNPNTRESAADVPPLRSSKQASR